MAGSPVGGGLRDPSAREQYLAVLVVWLNEAAWAAARCSLGPAVVWPGARLGEE